MRKILIIFMMCIVCSTFAYKAEHLTVETPMENIIHIKSDIPFGRIKYNFFTKFITTKVVVKVYDKYDNKVWRDKLSINLGHINAYIKHQTGFIKNNTLYEYLTNGSGYVVFSYIIFPNEEIDIVIPCTHYGND